MGIGNEPLSIFLASDSPKRRALLDLRIGATNTLRNNETPIDYVRVKYKYSAYDDYQRVGLVNVPILAGMRFVGAYDYYFLAGLKVGLPVLGYNSTKGRAEVEVLDEVNAVDRKSVV